MSTLQKMLDRPRLILTLALTLSVAGATAWLTMARQEDPRLANYWGQLVITYPGADAEMVERLVVTPIEDRFAEVAEIRWLDVTASSEVAVFQIELREDTGDITAAWDDIREAIDKARLEFPQGVGEPRLEDDISGLQESVVLAVTGSTDLMQLLAAGRRLENRLLAMPEVSQVLMVADPGEQITVQIDDATARSLGLSAGAVAQQLAARTQIVPGGSLHLGDMTVRLRPLSELQSVEEIAATPVILPSGGAVPLGEVARVGLGPQEPEKARMRFNGEMAVGLGIVATEEINVVDFGKQLREVVAGAAPDLAPLAIHEVSFQPQRVADRLSDLSRSLLMSILIVAGVVVLAMGLRLGLVVASVVPLVASASLAIYAFGGGVLHQISIAALVLALGMLVDNAIVVAENVQWRLDRGEARATAAAAAVRELAVPLGAATATTIAAFLPMLLSRGGTADFTRAIPVLIMLTLSVSYLFAVFVTPIVSRMSLQPGSVRTAAITERLGGLLSRLALRRSGLVLGVAAVMVAASLIATSWVRQQFFPTSDRNQLTVSLKMPEGSHLDATDHATRQLEKALLGRGEVRTVASFVGRSAPKFYYNIQRVPFSPHFAQIVVETKSRDDLQPVLDWLREIAAKEVPQAEVVASKLEQGPPVNAPVEIRLFGDDLDDLHTAAVAVATELRKIPGTRDVRHNLGPGAPNLRFVIDDAAAARYGLSRAEVAQTLYGATRGLPVGELRSGDDPIPIVVRSPAGENTAAEDLQTTDISTPTGGSVPLAQIARIETSWRPAAINHRDRRRVVSVLSQVADGATFSEILAALEPSLQRLELPGGVSHAFGGEAEGSGDANSALLHTVPAGVVLLLGVLLAEFNSFRRLAIILASVPLAAAGVVPGLLIGGQPFGFMSLLGVIALVGIVVNNAIVLLEVVESRRREGAAIDQALGDAVSRRIRPILLTTTTTVAGLLPLAFSSSSLWPPLAWAMISGLLASTMLTLVVVPAMYRLLFLRQAAAAAVPGDLVPKAVVVLLLVLLPATAGVAGEPRRLSLAETMTLAGRRPAARAAIERADAADQAARAERRVALLPVIGSSVSLSDRDRELELITPIGAFPFGESRQLSAGIEITQPLLDPSRLLFTAKAARSDAEAAHHQARRTRRELAAAAAAVHLDLLAIDARLAATEPYIHSLGARLAEVEELVTAGRALEADALKVRLALEQAEQDRHALQQARSAARARLAQAAGLDQAVEPLPVPDLRGRPVPEAATLLNTALAARSDLRALGARAAALERRRAAVRAELLPRLDARVAWSYSDGSPYSTNNWIEGSLMVTWTPFAAGTRGPRAAATAATHRAATAELEETERAVREQLVRAISVIHTARPAVTVAERGIEQATETLRVERERLLAGRTTTNDVLEAEARLRERRTSRDLARLEVVRAWVALWLASGGTAGGPEFPSGAS